LLAEILDLAQAKRVTVKRVGRGKLDSAARTEAPQGVLAHAEPLPEADLDQLAKRRPDGPPPFLVVLDGVTDRSFTLHAYANRRLTRSSGYDLGAHASWFDSDAVDFDSVFSTGATFSYSRSFLLERLRLLAALGLYHSDDGTLDSTVASGLVGLRYTF